MNETLYTFLIIFFGFFLFLGLLWLGFQYEPKPFHPPQEKMNHTLRLARVPENLPLSVQRYYAAAIGMQVPVVETAVIWGRARILKGTWLPLRFRVYCIPGKAFFREMEITWYGRTIFRVIDSYIGGNCVRVFNRRELSGEHADQGANILAWSEGVLFPSVYLSDNITWAVVDPYTARLTVPFADRTDDLTVSFDPQSNLPKRLHAELYKSTSLVPWAFELGEWKNFFGMRLPTRLSEFWANERRPSQVWKIEGIAWNLDISQVIPGGIVSKGTAVSWSEA